MDDWELLQAYAQRRDEAAFTELVNRHINLVYSAALRELREQHDAQEVTQAVFIILARKASGLGRDRALAPWLMQTTHYTAANARRSLHRRQQLESLIAKEGLLPEFEAAWARIASDVFKGAPVGAIPPLVESTLTAFHWANLGRMAIWGGAAALIISGGILTITSSDSVRSQSISVTYQATADPHVPFSVTVATDENGHFTVAKVPPGRHRISRVVTIPDSPGIRAPSHAAEVSVLAGQVAEVLLDDSTVPLANPATR